MYCFCNLFPRVCVEVYDRWRHVYLSTSIVLQDAVKAAGPRLAILGFLFLPFIWSVPEALICAELATAFPENSGYVVWVETAFGPFFGFLEGLFSWVSGVTDNTVYPIMLISYVELFVPALSSSWWLNKCEFCSSLCLISSIHEQYVSDRHAAQ